MNDLILGGQRSLADFRMPQKPLMEWRRRLDYIEWLTTCALDAESSMHVYTIIKLTLTVQQAELLKASCQCLSPDAEAAYNRLTMKYISSMEAINQHASAEILIELKNVPTDFNESLLDRLVALFRA